MKKHLLAILLFSLAMGSCEKNCEPKKPKKSDHLNVTVLLDLSSRINAESDKNRSLQPPPSDRDREIIKEILSNFKARKKGEILSSKDKIRVVFSPAPSDPEINSLAKSLSVDFETMPQKDKKPAYQSLLANFDKTLKQIYAKATSGKKTEKDFPGSDIWRFFRSDVKELGIESNPEFRNVLVILTDGYLLHEQSLNERKGNRTGFISEGLLGREGLRGSNWQEKFDKGDYGLISFGQDYSNLEVFVFEINPTVGSPNDEYVIKAYLQKWFKEMKVKGAEEDRIFKTDLPENTKKRIQTFFNVTSN